MKAILKPCAFTAIFILLLLCSCATTRPALPGVVSMNEDAGRGGWLIAMIRVNGSEPMPFIVDTGCPVTCLDQSLEPKLGKRLSDAVFLNLGVSHSGGAYPPPRLCLADTPLRKSGEFVVTLDCKPLGEAAHRPVMGFLGMDVLKHYCVQMDFQSGEMRFLDGARADKSAWGRAFHLNGLSDGCVAVAGNLTRTKGAPSLIDTGCDHDGFLVSKLFERWTNHSAPLIHGEARSPDGALDGEIYHELELSCIPAADHDGHARFNVIGLHVLSRNLVTFDFPGRTMYLKRTSDWALLSKENEAMMASAAKSAIAVAQSLKEQGQLPGWSRLDHGMARDCHFHHADGVDLVTIDDQKQGDSSVYHHTFVRESHSSGWKLQKAWRTDTDGNTIEEFPLPESEGGVPVPGK